jgi:high-affinity iron transporter
MDWSAIVPTFLITLREGVEAALVVGIVLAYLNKAGQSALNRWVYAGIAAGLLASVGVGVLLNGSLWLVSRSANPYAGAIKPLMEAGFGLVAIGLLSWMLVWMTRQAKTLKGSIESQVADQTQNAGWGIFSIIFLAVLREGFETVVFIAAQFQAGWLPTLGAGLGVMGATIVGALLFKWGVRINLGKFFQVMGLFLLLIVGGLSVGMLAHLDQGLVALGRCGDRAVCILGPIVWDLHASLPDRQFPGIILKTLLGYRDRLYVLEAVVYVLLQATVGGLYFRSLNQKSLNKAIVNAPLPDYT